MTAEDEVQEHVQHARNSFDKTVAGTMAVIGALLAIVSVAGQHYTTEELLLQQRASDQWSYYQAKSIRRFISRTTSDTVSQIKGDSSLVKKYDAAEQKYKNDGEEITREAQKLEKESQEHGRQANRYHLGEVFLEIAIVFSSLSILMKRPLLFAGAVCSAIAGAILALTALSV
ncbi:MAG TPA: DUF4337 domain-containing protein [Bryobacteraceae bacterium]|nr:DUF4337 domain-containing protein [Bryobacteraceae bacterium]